MMMNKIYLKGIVRNGGKGKLGIGVEAFRLDGAENELTEMEQEALEEDSVGEALDQVGLVRIYEDIGEDFWTGTGISAKKFAEQLDNFGSLRRLNIHINSLGGDAFTAQAISSTIEDYKAKVYCYVDGVCASAATLIACAGNDVVARHNSNYMIHNPWAMVVGNAEAMREAAHTLDKITEPIVNVYEKQVRGKIDQKKIKALMAAETWMTADDALEYGFVDRIRGKMRPIAKVGKSTIFCSGQVMDYGKYHYQNVPDYPISKPTMLVDPPKIERIKQMAEITLETVERDNPEILVAVRKQAAEAERARLTALDSMLVPGLEELVAKAKADGRGPEAIAMEAFNLTKEQMRQQSTLNALQRDSNTMAGIKGGDAPMIAPEGTQERIKGYLLNAQKALNEKRGRNNNHSAMK
jgi:ATP-dependent Clp protease protease subunit